MPRSLVNLVDEVGLNTRVGALEAVASVTKNYIGNANFASGNVAGWSKNTVTVDGTTKALSGNIVSGAASITLAADAATPISGTHDLSITGTIAAGAALISDAFAVDREDQAKVLNFSFSYEAVSGAMNFSGTSANTWAVWIAETTVATPNTVVNWIQPAGVYNLTQSSGVGLCSGTFQTSASGTAYRLVLVCINAPGVAVQLNVDNFIVSPQKIVYGSPVTDWQSYPVTISGSISNPTEGAGSVKTAYWRRVGDSLEILFDYAQSAAGTAGSGNYEFNIPSGLVVDTSKFTGAITGLGLATSIAGYGQVYDGANAYDLTVLLATSTKLWLVPTGFPNPIGSATFSLATATRRFVFSAKVPILGWSSTVQMSNDTDTRVVAARASGGSSAYGAGGILQYNSVTYDTHGAITTGAGWRFTAPVSGYYRVGLSSTRSSSGVQSHVVYVSGVIYQFVMTNVSGTTSYMSGATTVYLNAGQYLDIRTDNAATIEVGVITVERLSGPATIAASETVAACYTTTSAQTLNNNVPSLVDFSTKQYDTHSMYTQGSGYNPATGLWTTNPTFTIPVSGKYTITAQAMINTVSWSTSGTVNVLELSFTKNGVFGVPLFDAKRPRSGEPLPSVLGTVTVQLNAGDVISIQVRQNSGFNLSLLNNTYANYVMLTRVGN